MAEQASLPSGEDSLQSFALAALSEGIPFFIMATVADTLEGSHLTAICTALWAHPGRCISLLGTMTLRKPPAIESPTKFTLWALSRTNHSAANAKYHELASIAGAIVIARGMADSGMKPGTTLAHLWTSMVFGRMFGSEVALRLPDISPDTYILNPFTASVALWRQLLDPPKARDMGMNNTVMGSQVSLSQSQQHVLIAMRELGAVSSDSRQTADDVAERSGVTDCKRAISSLKRLSLVDTKEGRGGGSWLTVIGRGRADELAS